jgi:hypothetical protein
MVTLDCETYSTTIKSLSKIYRVTTDDLESFFLKFDIEDHFERNNPDKMGYEELRLVFENECKTEPLELDNVNWYHLTRCLEEETFNEGILPLSKSLEKVWNMFFSCFTGTEHYANLVDMHVTEVNNDLYNFKVGDDLHSGPYAMLVKDVAFNAKKIGNHDYLGIPEIVQDVCRGYEKRFNVSIEKQLKRMLKPKVVKFISKKKTDVSCIEAALYYAYLCFNDSELTLNSNTCFNGENTIISPENIVYVKTI